ncbi:hypothetical protein [Synechococcus elongatus]|uniref:Uncharacterized protein n=2 Tax=Synechococcus elongatus TaxID=32046 RepID=Q8GMS7_SYNE7|nr:hypothetical protein [Synechococcus elongatus]ABB56493.1 conserved hypothetical protein [Synechococcus elongatus PCC 7942 = FACHB-805]AJD56463.1 hypothetical protein M744_00660 [Synechococcus elongatus UTEX 2973]MBD2588925.1 hypothetical protein [Synechococcus elongatus FACHB-242]MBD2689991.1 hypothetical protein [Synechococcus elongatus FACHB-1061]MBD2706962.1 hypothetical protein [Synechococcus elongatus PCC 7942 = FACHB-805]
MLDSDRREGLLPPLRVLLTLLLAIGVIFRSYEPQDITLPWTGLSLPFIPDSRAELFDAAYNCFWIATLVAIALVLLEWDGQRIGRNRRAESRNRDAAREQQEARRARIQAQVLVAIGQQQLNDSAESRQRLADAIALLQEYGDLL